MPRRAVTNVTDIPVDILCRLITDPDSYGELIDGWRSAKGEAIRDRQRAEEAIRIANKQEVAAAERLEAAATRESELDEKELALAELDQDFGARSAAIAEREQAAQAREQELAGRETTLDERLAAVRLDLAALKGL